MRFVATAWRLFQEIEREGGAAEALANPARSNRAVAKVRAEREANVARRKDTLIGTSDFPDLAEDKVAVLAQARLASVVELQRTALTPHQARRAVRALARPKRRLSRASMARGRRSSSPVSAAPPISMRGRASPRACSRPAASRRWKETATTSRNDSRNRARSLPASAPRTRSMSARPKPPPRRSPKPARQHVYLAGKPGANQAALGEGGR